MFKRNKFVRYNIKKVRNGKKNILFISWIIAWILTFTWLSLLLKKSKMVIK